MSLPVLGSLYLGFTRNGLPVWTQPGGIGTPVYPQAPLVYPQVNEGFPQQVMAYEAQLVGFCGHWFNVPEVFKEYDSSTGKQAAIVCCPVCSGILLIVEPYEDWSSSFFMVYPVGLGV